MKNSKMKDKTVILGYIVLFVALMLFAPEQVDWMEYEHAHYSSTVIFLVATINLAIAIRVIFWLLEEYKKLHW